MQKSKEFQEIPKVKVVGAEAEYLLELPEEHRADALANYRELCTISKFNNKFEQSKCMKFFYIGYAAALARVGGECGPQGGSVEP